MLSRETNVANAKLQAGNDQPAEIMGLEAFRKSKIPRTPVGPAYHLNLIRTIPGMTSWLRVYAVSAVILSCNFASL